MSIAAALSIATNSLANINRQLGLVSHNVANAATSGYVRERGTQTALAAEGVGLGVRSGPALRDVDFLLRAELTAQQANTNGAMARQRALQGIDALHGVPGDGSDLPSLLGTMQTAFSALAGDPANAAGQRQVSRAADNLARGINALGAAYLAERQAAQDALSADVTALNTGLANIGYLTTRITALRAAGMGSADLENERDAAVAGIAGLVELKAVEQGNGGMLLLTSSGLTLPTDGAAPFSMAPATVGASAFHPGGGVPGVMRNGIDVTAQLRGGRIGANLTLRDRTLPVFQAELDEFAQSLAARFDAQGMRLFSDPTGAVPSGGGVPVQAGYVGFAVNIQVDAAVVADATLLRDGTHVVAGGPTGASAFTPNPVGGPAGFTGLIHRILDFAFGAEAQAGVAQAAVHAAGLGPDGTLTAPFAVQTTLGAMARDVVATQATEAAAAADQVVLETSVRDRLAARYADVTGVDIDAEMALMLQLQNAYGANARVISASQSMWDQLLNAVR